MNETEALYRLEVMLAADSDPVLDAGEMDMVFASARRPDSFGNLPTNVSTAPTWLPSHAYVVGDVVTASPAADRWWMATVAGTSAAIQPSWPYQAGASPQWAYLLDGTSLRWLDVGSVWVPTWDLAAAASLGWELKAGKAAGRFDFLTDGQQFARGQVVAHCNAMASRYRRRVVASAPIAS